MRNKKKKKLKIDEGKIMLLAVLIISVKSGALVSSKLKQTQKGNQETSLLPTSSLCQYYPGS